VTPVRLRILLWLDLALLLGALAWVGSVGFHYPAAAGPAGLGALIGALRFARTHRDDSPLTMFPSHQLYGACIRSGIVFGVVGYAAFAASGVGVPDASAALEWRLFGGAVFGALAGVVAGWAAALVTSLWLVATRYWRRGHGAA
jgi:hypothetical protein